MGDWIWILVLPFISGAIGGAFVVWLTASPKRPNMPTWANHEHHHDWRGL
jgi:uncharacterized protein YjaZ